MNRLRRRQRMAISLVGGLLLVTGAAWAVLHYLPGWLGVEERSAVAANAILMKVHGAAAMLSLLLLGAMLVLHVGVGWRSTRNKASGVLILGLSGLLLATGYLLYYAGSEEVRQAASLLHLAAGIALPVVIMFHALRLMLARRRHVAGLRALRRRHARGAMEQHAL